MFTLLFAQSHTPEQIDSLLEAAEKERIQVNITQYLDKELSILKEAQKINYSKGIAKAHYGAGLAFMVLGKSNEAIEHFLLTEKEDYSKTDFPLLSETNRFLGECYANLGLYDLAIERHRKAIHIVEESEDVLLDYYKAVNYLDIGVDLHLQKNLQDSNHYYLTKAFYHIKRSPENLKNYTKETKNAVTAVIASNLGAHWNERKNLDSANYYYLKALERTRDAKNIIIEASVLAMMGDFFLRNKQYPEAIEYYNKCIQISEGSRNLYKLRECYKGISEAYKNTGNEKRYIKYSQLYIDLNDSIIASEKKGVNIAVGQIADDQKTIYEKSKLKLSWIIAGTIFTALLISLLAFLFHQKVRKKKELEIIEKDKLITQKQEETQELSLKLNAAFEEVVSLAKENNPEFLTRFKEVYPKFCEKLKEIYPELNSDDLRFCALLKLNFSTKDIAEYTFVTVRSVQTRKSRLRKRLQIASSDDIYLWMNDLGKTNQ